MKYYIPFILLLFSSCSIQKKINKEKTEVKTETVSTRTITESVDTSVFLRPVELLASGSLEELLNHGIESENGDLSISVKVDPVTKKVKAKATRKQKEIPIIFNRKIEEKSETKTQEKKQSKVKDVQKDSGFNWNWLWLIVAAVIGYFIWKKS